MQAVDISDFGFGLLIGVSIGWFSWVLVNFLSKWAVTFTRKDKK